MKKGFWLALTLVLCIALCSAQADIEPSVIGSSISTTSGEAPLTVTITITSPISVRGMRVVDLYGDVRTGVETQKQNINGTQTFYLETTFDSAYQGTLSVYILTVNDTWLPTNVVFDVNYTMPVLTPIPTPTHYALPIVTLAPQAAASVRAGEVLLFGHYEQDNDRNNGKEAVEWTVLEVDSRANRALLLSTDVLDMQRFNESWSSVSWAKCTVRTWLNDVFYANCFDDVEKRAIVQTALSTRHGNDYVSTNDHVFFLSADEAKQYFSSNADRRAAPTSYAVAREAVKQSGSAYWWLRDSTNRKNDANRINPQGKVEDYGANTNAYGVGIRPAIWIDLGAFAQ